jgi:hypothetical protein
MFPILVLIVLHAGSGTPMDVNTATITNLRNPDPTISVFSKGVKCQVNMVDGKFVTVQETCAEVRRLMETTK